MSLQPEAKASPLLSETISAHLLVSRSLMYMYQITHIHVKKKMGVGKATPRIDTERLQLLLEVYKETEGQPPVIRASKLFYKLCSEKAIFIDGNPIVGTLTKYKYGSYPMPEFGCRWMRKIDKFSLQRGNADLTEEDKEWVDRAVDYWQDRNVFNQTREIILQSHGLDIGLLAKCGVGTELTPGGFINGIS
jgi:formate C-acetyltransferase